MQAVSDDRRGGIATARSVRMPDPARGVGQALRTIYMPAKSNIPPDLQSLLDRLS